MTRAPDEVIEQLEAATAAARELLAEIRSELKEARRVHRQVQDDVAGADEKLRAAVDARFADLVRDGLDRYADSVRQATDKAHASVIANMERLANYALYGNEQGRGVHVFEEIAAKHRGDSVPPGPATRRKRGKR